LSDLLALAVSAHGGLERWNSFRTLEARMSVGGGIFAAKQNPGLQDNVTYKVFTREERLTIDHFSAPDRRISFVPSRLTLEIMGGEVVEVEGRSALRVRGPDERIRLGIPSTSLISPVMLCGPT
jgi:hypothetical protein